MSDRVIKHVPPRPQGVLVVVSAHPVDTRSAKEVRAKVVVRDETGAEFSFVAKAVPRQLTPFYR